MSGPGNGVTAAAGFRASGIHCGLRREHPDLALVVSDRPAVAAAVFTTNRVQAAPVTESKTRLAASGGRARAIVVNAGNANACTGGSGDQAARQTVEETARLLGLPPDEVLVASTGVIGQQLAVDKILAALPHGVAELSTEGGEAAARAILTTDTFAKQSMRRVVEPEGSYTIGAMAKGSGMIHPDLATTLAFVTTDAEVEPAVLQRALEKAIDRSFHRVTIDGDTSTNDMVAALANGASGIHVGGGPRREDFERTLTTVLTQLARDVARDGEGASRLITVRVTGAASDADALTVARVISGSLLVRTAVYGADANWGRIVAAAGRSGVAVEPERMTVRLNGLAVLEPGYVSEFSEEEARDRLASDEVELGLDLGQGDGEAETWTCDLTEGYIEINANYRT